MYTTGSEIRLNSLISELTHISDPSLCYYQATFLDGSWVYIVHVFLHTGNPWPRLC